MSGCLPATFNETKKQQKPAQALFPADQVTTPAPQDAGLACRHFLHDISAAARAPLRNVFLLQVDAARYDEQGA